MGGPDAGGDAGFYFVDVPGEGLRKTAESGEVHRVDVVLVRVDENISGEGELRLFIVDQQEAVVPAVGAGLVHDGRDVARGGVEIADVEEGGIVLVSAAEEGIVFDDHLAGRRNEGRRGGAVHAFGVDDGGDEF